MEYVLHILEIALVVIGACSTIVAGMRQIAKLTSTTKDDEVLEKVDGWIKVVYDVLSKIALNPKSTK